jgi:predicted dienelactone hydrolase
VREKLRRLVIAIALCSVPAAWLAAQQGSSNSLSQSGVRQDSALYAVEIARYDWYDQKRQRNIPVKIYYPKTGGGLFPVIVFSHGLGGSREGYEYLGQYWASHGYVSVHLQHLGSDTAVWQHAERPMRAMG